MGHKYIKEDDTFSTSRNGTVPKPTQQDVSDDKVLHADGSWGTGGGSGGSSTLDGLDDVDISSLSDGQGLFYDSTEQKWKNADPPSGGGDVTDVLQDGQSVVDENGVARITSPSVPSDLDDLSDVDLSSPTTDDYLGYDSQTGKWVNKPVSGGGGSGNVDDVQVNGVSVVDANKVAQIKGYKEVTKAQYDALPSSKNSDGILYCIKDDGMVEGNKFAPVIYSNAEQEIGTWVDGKPLYAITKDLPSASTNQWVIGATLDTNCEIKLYTGFIIDAQYGQQFPIEGGFCYTNVNDYSGGNVGFNIFKFCPKQSLSASGGKVTLYYTKTTDVPGSGKWSTYGVPNHHYSTDEQVIGTWIDGKPLYEKVISGLNYVSTQSWVSTGISIQNLNLVISCKFAQVLNNSLFSFVDYFICKNDGNGNVMAWSTSGSQYTYNAAIIQYTKTTD